MPTRPGTARSRSGAIYRAPLKDYSNKTHQNVLLLQAGEGSEQ